MARWLVYPLAVALLPHELLHYLVLRPWSASLRVTLAPTDGPQVTGDVVLGRIDGRLRPGTPTAVVRVAALAPTVGFPLAAGGLVFAAGQAGIAVPRLAVFVPFALWAVPSGGDLQVFLHADRVAAANRFDAAGPVGSVADATSAVLTVLAGGATAALVFLS